MTKEEIFWNWFIENESKYYFLNQISNIKEKEKLLDEFLSQLHNYSDKLYFEIGGIPNMPQELIISAGGNKKYFDVVEKLISKAPIIPEWEIIAFKPASQIDFITNYEGVELDPQNMWFLPLENEDSVGLGLKVCIENYNPNRNKLFLNATFQILDTILGEKSTMLDIEYVEVSKLSKNPEKDGLIRLPELPLYINWRKTKLTS